jgi:hypothetical protein
MRQDLLDFDIMRGCRHGCGKHAAQILKFKKGSLG